MTAGKVLANQEKQSGFIEASKKSGVFFHTGKAGGWRNVLNRKQIDTVIRLHGEVRKEFGYLDENGDIID